MPKAVSAITGRVTYFNDSDSHQASAAVIPSGPVPVIPSGWSTAQPTTPSVSVVQERREFVPSQAPFPGETRVSVSRPRFQESRVDSRRPDRLSALRDVSTGIGEPVTRVQEFRPATLQEAKTIPQAVGVAGRSLEAAVKEVFPTLRGKGYTQEELRSWRPNESIQMFESRIQTERGIGSGLSLALAAIPIGKIGQVGAKALPKIVGTGTTARLFSQFFGGLAGRGGIYAPKGIVTKGIEQIGIQSGRIPFVGRYIPGIAGATIASQTGVPIVKGAVEVVEPSELTTKEQIKLSQDVRAKVEERIQKEGLDIPFVGQDIKRFTGGFLGSLVYGLPGGTATVSTKYYEETIKVLKERGYSEKDAIRIAQTESKREATAGAIGEVGAFAISAQTLGELGGRFTSKGLSIVLGIGKKAVTKKSGTFTGAVLGASGGIVGGGLEGALIYPALQEARYKPISEKDWLFTTLLSAGTAGLAGGVIGGLSVATPKAGSIVYKALGVAEAGQEFLGDIGATKIAGKDLDVYLNIIGKGTKGIKKGTKGIKKGTKGIKKGTKGIKKGTKGIKTRGIGFVPVSPITKTKRTKAKVPTVTETPSVEEISSIISAKPIKSTVWTPVPGTTLVSTPIPIRARTPTQTPIPERPLTTEEITQRTETPTTTPEYTFTPTTVPTFVPTFTGDFMPFIPPIVGGGEFRRKKTRRERTRFIDEFSAAFAGLVRPSQPVVFGKQKPITLARKMYKPKKRKTRKKPSRTGGVNFERLDALFF